MSDKPREWTIWCKGQWCQVIGPDAHELKVIERSAYTDAISSHRDMLKLDQERCRVIDILTKERDEARAELAELEKWNEDAEERCSRHYRDKLAERAKSAKLAEALKLVQQISNSDEFVSVFTCAQIHGMPYKGGQYGEAIKAALAEYNGESE